MTRALRARLLAALLLVLSADCSPLGAQSFSSPRDLHTDTWVGTDGLNRRLPTFKEVGLPKRNKTVGIFYFLTSNRSDVGPYDNSKILAAHPRAILNPNDRIWGPLYSPHYWSEPLFGYYLTDDDWVLRKHAQMLVAAGVDVVIFDNSNAVTYDRYRNELLKVWEQMRREGDPTPQIAFFCPFSNYDNIGTNTITSLYNSLYSKGLYSDLWFRWDGKPLIIADKSYADQSSVQALPQKSAELAVRMQNFFTFRSPIGPYNTRHPQPGQWAWLQIYPQAVQTDPNGKPEEITVGVAQNYNANVNNTAPMSFPGAFGRSYHAGREDTARNAMDWGYNVQEQWDRANQANPPFVFVTGWNEWTASIFDKWVTFTAPPAIFVDEYDEEFSRDIEPMSGGFGDDYYYQLVSNIRRYKGVHQIDPVHSKHINLNAGFSQWANIGPEFRDFVGDNVHRNSIGTGKAGPYINTTGRNDIVAAKVSYDAQNIYFYVRAASTLSPRTDHNWMILYLNTDSNSRTGWLGYDYAVNQNVGANTTSLDKNVGNAYRWSERHVVPYKVKGDELEISIPRADLGMSRYLSTIDFKWADNCYDKGDWTDFTLNGDAAPDGRFSYRAIFSH